VWGLHGPCARRRGRARSRSLLVVTAMGPKKLPMSRRVWRMTADAPLGELVDFDPTEEDGVHRDAPLKVLDPATVVDWRGSSFDLLNGVDVRDHSHSIPGELFHRLFKR